MLTVQAADTPKYASTIRTYVTIAKGTEIQVDTARKICVIGQENLEACKNEEKVESTLEASQGQSWTADQDYTCITVDSDTENAGAELVYLIPKGLFFSFGNYGNPGDVIKSGKLYQPLVISQSYPSDLAVKTIKLGTANYCYVTKADNLVIGKNSTEFRAIAVKPGDNEAVYETITKPVIPAQGTAQIESGNYQIPSDADFSFYITRSDGTSANYGSGDSFRLSENYNVYYAVDMQSGAKHDNDFVLIPDSGIQTLQTGMMISDQYSFYYGTIQGDLNQGGRQYIIMCMAIAADNNGTIYTIAANGAPKFMMENVLVLNSENKLEWVNASDWKKQHENEKKEDSISGNDNPGETQPVEQPKEPSRKAEVPAWMADPKSPAAVEYQTMLSRVNTDPKSSVSLEANKPGAGATIAPSMQGSKCLAVFDAVASAHHYTESGTYIITKKSEAVKDVVVNFNLPAAMTNQKVVLIVVAPDGQFKIYQNQSTVAGEYKASVDTTGAAMICVQKEE